MLLCLVLVVMDKTLVKYVSRVRGVLQINTYPQLMYKMTSEGKEKRVSPWGWCLVNAQQLPTPVPLLLSVSSRYFSRSFFARFLNLVTHTLVHFLYFSTVILVFTMLSCYQLAIRLTTLTNLYDLMTIPFILFLSFIHILSFDEMRT